MSRPVQKESARIKENALRQKFSDEGKGWDTINKQGEKGRRTADTRGPKRGAHGGGGAEQTADLPRTIPNH
jgi:hypothetical protein